jgi:hypothetical protein
MWRLRSILLLVSMLLGCLPAVIDDDIVRPKPGTSLLEELPGPLMGPFNSFEDALLAACRKIITKPNAVAPSQDLQNFATYWRASSEYCAWIYYTPEGTYELSKLTDQSKVDPAHREKTCWLPPTVRDQRYSPSSIKHICALHNHLFDDPLSTTDLKFIIQEGSRHGEPPYYGFLHQTRDGERLLSIVAFFSNQIQNPTCDGYYQYFPLAGLIVKVTRIGNRSNCDQFGLVEWDDAMEIPTIKKMNGPCPM